MFVKLHIQNKYIYANTYSIDKNSRNQEELKKKKYEQTEIIKVCKPLIFP